ncbi:uncharacterized protein LOC128222623 [Mya arenaria]|uniref:uncharacterized protein LOC128222623 n=1 Tax=Mya arenaria TaxID=6604 RepID=UPI0022E59D71|nr:uncharacterized protein LOC128222623 [Mya arenaria]XP_052787673.1 uncharacterized protein LOC128222623 [Mya arenaria]
MVIIEVSKMEILYDIPCRRQENIIGVGKADNGFRTRKRVRSDHLPRNPIQSRHGDRWYALTVVLLIYSTLSTASGQVIDRKAGIVNNVTGCLVEVNQKSEVNLRWTTQENNQLMDALVDGKLIANYDLHLGDYQLYNNNDSNVYAPFMFENKTCQLTIKKVERHILKILITGTDIDNFEVSGKRAAICRDFNSGWIYLKVTVNTTNTNEISPHKANLEIIIGATVGSALLVTLIVAAVILFIRRRTATRSGGVNGDGTSSRDHEQFLSDRTTNETRQGNVAFLRQKYEKNDTKSCLEDESSG